MNAQINIRFPSNLLASAKLYAEKHGFGTIQEFIKETIRETLFEPSGLSKKELSMVRKLSVVTEKKNLYGTEGELLRKLRRNR